ncbi:MAG TPA: hypothetical protein VGB18_08510 [Candidatus Thermoplasmatota archaeon]
MVALVAAGLLQVLSLFVLVPAFTVGELQMTDEAGDASNTCEGYTQEFGTGDEVEGHVEPPLDTADWYGYEITSDDVTAADGGHAYVTNGTPPPMQIQFFDSNADSFYNHTEPWYFSQTPGTISVGDIRLTPVGSKAAGTKVTASDSAELGLPMIDDFGAALYRDNDADATWNWGDALFWDADENDFISVGDLRLTDTPTYQAGAVVMTGDDDVGELLMEFPIGGDPQYVDSAPTGYGIEDAVYGDFANFGVVGSLDIRLSGPNYGSIVVEQTLYVIIQETASQEGYHLDGDAREVEEDVAGRHCSESVVGEEDGKQVTARLSPYTCDSTKWSFVINQVKPGASAAPASIHVEWQNGLELDVSMTKFTGKVAHYTTSFNLVSPVVFAEAFIYEEWSGNFNLGRGPCLAAAKMQSRSDAMMSHIASDCAANPDKQQWGNTTVISFQATQPCTFAVGVRLIQEGAPVPDAQRDPAQGGLSEGGCHEAGCVAYVLALMTERSEDDECLDCHPPAL